MNHIWQIRVLCWACHGVDVFRARHPMGWFHCLRCGGLNAMALAEGRWWHWHRETKRRN